MSGDRSFDWLGDGVAELLTNDLAQTKTLDVISTERVRGLIRRRVRGDGRLPPEDAQDVARDVRADLFLSGALLRVGTGLRLDLRVQETDTGRVVFADKVEGQSTQAVFAMVDKATAGILSQLAPVESSQLNVGASLTANLDALHAYEEGIGYFGRFLLEDATNAFRRAIKIDPQFAMAYYQLARLSFDDLAAARLEIAPAANLAERLPLPRQQKLLIQAAQFRYEGRSQEAEQVLQMLMREYPREIEPRSMLWAVLGIDQGRFVEGKPLLEEVLRIDERHAYAYNSLAYADAAEGDLKDALAAVDKYASLLPHSDPNPIDTRGDVLAMTGHYSEAAAQYRQNLVVNPSFWGRSYEDNKVALSYLYDGNYSMAETSARSAYKKSIGVERALAIGVLGDIEVGRGRLGQAVVYYERAARMFTEHRSPLAEAPLRKAVHICLEQGLLDAALALGRHDRSPWAYGAGAMAYLLLRDEFAAEKEFDNLRSSLSPVVGDYLADKTVEVDRLWATGYAGHWEQLIASSPQLGGLRRKDMVDLPVGRAYLETGAVLMAERHLRFVLHAERTWVNVTSIVFHDFLSYILAQFYVGRVLEHNGKKAEAIEAYRAFLSHFNNSNARLPQIAEARAALKRLS